MGQGLRFLWPVDAGTRVDPRNLPRAFIYNFTRMPAPGLELSQHVSVTKGGS